MLVQAERKTYVADAVFTVCGCEEEKREERKRRWLKNCCREFWCENVVTSAYVPAGCRRAAHITATQHNLFISI